MTKRRPAAVCIVVENLPVPFDRRVWREACALRDAGYQVSVICPKGKDASGASFEVLDEIYIHRHHAWEASTPIGYLLEYAWALAAELFLSLKVFSRTRFRILQGCNPPDTIFLIALFLRIFGVRFIFDHHDLSPELFEAKFGKRSGPFYALARLAEHWSFKVATVCVATNESFKEIAVIRGGKRAEQVFVVRNCPDLASVRAGAVQPGIKRGKRLLVVYVGIMGQQDGLDLLIESIEHIIKDEHRQDTQFVLVGGGEALPMLRALVTTKELDPFVALTGRVPPEEVATYLSNADVGVAPDPKNSLNDKSTMMKILEYMAYELPVVLFDLKEGRRIADQAALYAIPNDPIDFAHQITRLLNSDKLRRQLGECGRRRIEENLNWEIEKGALLRAYETALQGWEARAATSP